MKLLTYLLLVGVTVLVCLAATQDLYPYRMILGSAVFVAWLWVADEA